MNILGFSARRAVLALAFLAACSVPSQTYTPLDDAGTDAPTDANEVVELSVSTMNITVVEGQTATFTVQLTAQPAEPVLVSVDSEDDNRVGVAPTSLQFTSQNWNMPRTVTLSGRVDPNTVDEALNVTVSSSVGTKTIAVIVDDIDMLSVIATPMSGLQVDEGGTAQVAVHLSAQPTGQVMVTVMSSNPATATVSPATLTFGLGTWDVDQNVVVSGVVDADTANGMADLMLMATNVTGAVVPITVVDRDVLQIVPLPTNLGTLDEGGTTTFTVALNHQPTANVSVAVASSDITILTATPTPLAFTTANWMTPQTVTVNLPEDIDTANETATITLTATGVTGVTPRTISATIVDNDPQTVVAAPNPVALDEGTSRTLNVHLQFQPSANITLTATSLNPAVATLGTGSLTFTPANYATDQPITVTAPQDPDAAAGQTTIRLESLPDALSHDVAVAVTDDDQLLIAASAPSVSVTENGTVQLGVHLSAMPGGNVTVTAGSSDATAATVSPASLMFTTANYGTDQMFTITGVDDLDLAQETLTITLSAAGIPQRVVNVTVNDDDTQIVNVSATTIQVGEGATGQVGVSLGFIPASNVSVSVSSVDTTAATVTPATLTFTPANYNTPQNITITGASDADATNDTTTINATATGATPAAVTVTVIDDDVLGIQTEIGSVSCNEPGTAQLGIRLSAQPAASTVVTVMSSDVTAATVAPAMLTFTTSNYGTYQYVTVTGVSDADGIDDTLTLNLSAPAPIMPRSVNVTVVDDDVQDIVLSATTLTVTEQGASGTFNVHLAAQPTSDVMVTVASADANKATASPTTLTFTAANYLTNQAVTVSGVSDLNLVNESVNINLSSPGVPTKSVAVTVTDDDTQVVETTATGTVNLTEGAAGVAVGFRLRYQPAANVTVTLTLGAGISVAGGNTLVFTPANYNTVQQKTISAVTDPDAVDVTTTVTASAPSATSVIVDVFVDDIDVLGLDVAPQSLTVNEGSTGTYQVRLTAQPTATTAVSSAITAGGSAITINSGASLSFTTANWNTYQNVTIGGTQDVNIANEGANVAVSSGTLPTKNVSITVIDDDPLTLVSPASVTVNEGATATFTVALSNQPSSNVSVGVASSVTTAATVSPATLAFDVNNWNMPQTVTVTGVADADAIDGSSTIALTSASTPTKNVSATVLDDDITLTNMSVQMGPAAGGGVSTATGTGFTAAVSTTMAGNAVIGWLASSSTSANFTIPAKSATGGNWSDLRMVKAGNTVSIPRAHYYGQWQPITVGGGTVYVVKTAGTSIVYAGTYSGVYVSSNNGATWTRATPNGGGGWYDDLAVHPTNPDIAYVPLFDGVYGTTDRGTTWARMGALSVSTSCVAVNPATPTTIYTCTGTEVQRSTDSGATWTVVKSGLSSPRMISFTNNGSVGWLATNAGIFRTTDAGATWNPANGQLGNPSAVAIVASPIAGAIAYVSIQGGPPSGIMKTTDGGLNWSTQISSVVPSDFAIHPNNDSVVYGSSGTGIFQTTNGSTWAEIDTGVPVWAQQSSGVALRASTPAEVYRVGPTGVYKSTTSGSSWTKSDSGMDAYNVSAIATHPTTPGTLSIATATGAWRSTDYGATWTQIMTGVTGVYGTVNHIVYAPSQGTTMYMTMSAGNLWKSTDSGSNWSVAGSVTNASAIAVDPANASIVYLLHYPEYVMKSTDGGATFAAAGSGIPANSNIYDIAMVPGALIAADGVAGIYRSTNGGASWTLSNSGFPANGARVLSTDAFGNVYAITNGGGFRPYKSTDGGATWTQVATFGEAIAIDPTRQATGYITSFTSVSRTLNSFANTSSFSSGPLPTNSCCVGARIAVDKDGSSVYFGPPERGLFRLAP